MTETTKLTNETRTKINPAREKLIKGVNTLADTVKVTLGARGRTVLFNKKRDFEDTVGYPVITKDGVTVAKQVHSEDPYENMAIQIVREAAQKTVDSSGDGTTSTTVLAQYLIKNGFKLLDNSTMSAWELAEEFDNAVNKAIELIESYSIPVENNFEYLKKVATISSNDSKIGQMIYDVMTEIGVYGDIEPKKTDLAATEVELVKGMKLHKGYFSPWMCTDFEKMEWVVNEPYILVFDDVIRDMNDIAPYIQSAVYENGSVAPLFIYAKDVAKTALERIKQWKMVNPRDLVIVEHDGFGDRKDILVDDLCVITGAVPVDANSNVYPSEVLGRSRSISVTQKYTSIIDGYYDEDEVAATVETIEKIIESRNLSGVELKFHQKRLANLVGGIAVINVGGQTKVQMEEEYARIEDAVLAVKAAIKKGVSVGGAYTWEKVANDILSQEKSQNEAYLLIFKSMKEILSLLLSNAGESYREQDIRNSILLEDKAYDLKTRQFYNKDEYPVFDATSVLIDSLVNSAAVAKSVLTIEKSIYNGQVLIT